MTTVREPEDQGVSIVPSPLFFKQASFGNLFGPHKTLVGFSSTEKQIPSAFSVSTAQNQAALPSSLPRDFHTASAGAATAEGISPYFIPGRLSGHADLRSLPTAQGTQGQEAAWLKNPYARPPCPLQGSLGEGCATVGGGREKLQGMSEAKEKTHNPTRGTSPSSGKKARCRHGVSGDCLDPISKTFIACLGHL